jgi:hypothetical protein
MNHQERASTLLMLGVPLLSDMALEVRPVRQLRESRTLVYISKKVVDDSAFPFEPGQELVVRIEGKRLVIEAP